MLHVDDSRLVILFKNVVIPSYSVICSCIIIFHWFSDDDYYFHSQAIFLNILSIASSFLILVTVLIIY